MPESHGSGLPLVTIMIPVYNQAGFLGQCLESALGQDYGNIEVVVSDDCSDDGTEHIITPYLADSRLRYYRNSVNVGRVGNYRKILYEYALGEWVLNLDGDDYLTDNSFIRDAVGLLMGSTRAVALVAGQFVHEDGRVKTSLPVREMVEISDGVASFLDWNDSTAVFPHLACLYRRSLALSIDFYRYDILSSDWESLRRLILHGDLIRLGRPVGVWRGHENNATKSKRCDVYISNLDSILAPYEYALKGGLVAPGKLFRWKREALAEYLASYAKELIITAGLPDGIRLIRAGMAADAPAARRSILRLICNGKFWARYFLKSFFGAETMHAARNCWRRATWR